MKAITTWLREHDKPTITLAAAGLIVFALVAWLAMGSFPRTVLKIIAGTDVFLALCLAGNFLAQAVQSMFMNVGSKQANWIESREDFILAIIGFVICFFLAWWSTNFLPRSLVTWMAGVTIFAILVLAAYFVAKITKLRFSNDGDRLFS